jgi:predicted dehydrogenase
MDKLRVGVIGVGFIGALHARIFKELPAAQLVAVNDANANLARSKAKELECNYEESIRSLLDRKDIDAVSICTPDNFHVEPALLAAKAGKHILLEKPMARTTGDSVKIQQACEKANIRLMVAHILRFDSKYVRVHDEIAQGRIGELVHISAKKLNPRLTAQRIGNQTSILFYIGIHEIDIVQWFVGSRISRVISLKSNKVNKRYGADDCFFVLMNFENGVIGSMEFSWALPANYPVPIETGIEVVGSKGSAHLEVVGQGVRLHKESGIEIPEVTVWPEVNHQIMGDLRVELEHFVSATLNNKDFIMPTSDAIDAVRVTEAILKSAEIDQPVDIIR